MQSTVLIARTKHWFPDPGALGEELRADPEGVLDRAFPPSDAGRSVRAVVRTDAGAQEVSFSALAEAERTERLRLITDGATALEKVSRRGEATPLTPREALGYEAIIHIVARPALLVQNGRFAPPQAPWEGIESARLTLEKVLPSVGRVELTGDVRGRDWLGTAFLVAPGVVMTNRHVAVEFAVQGAEGSWSFAPGVSTRIDWREEYETPATAEFPLVEVIGIHDKLDLALLRVEARDDGQPTPLALAAEEPGDVRGRKVVVIGYPAWDPERNDAFAMVRIFSNVFGVKRLQPGYVTGRDDEMPFIAHDCSTLGGNSGSCVVDIETGRVLGLHFGGAYLQLNLAVALWRIQGDPLFDRAGVQFV
jgi:S1-C subfamily serine protease